MRYRGQGVSTSEGARLRPSTAKSVVLLLKLLSVITRCATLRGTTRSQTECLSDLMDLTEFTVLVLILVTTLYSTVQFVYYTLWLVMVYI